MYVDKILISDTHKIIFYNKFYNNNARVYFLVVWWKMYGEPCIEFLNLRYKYKQFYEYSTPSIYRD